VVNASPTFDQDLHDFQTVLGLEARKVGGLRLIGSLSR